MDATLDLIGHYQGGSSPESSGRLGRARVLYGHPEAAAR